MPKLTETFSNKIPFSKSGTQKYWDPEVKGLVLFVGKRSKTWYFQKDVGGQTRRVMIGRFPVISATAARQTALGFALDWARGAGRAIQVGAPTLEAAMEAYLARPKLRSEQYKDSVRSKLDRYMKDWMKLPLDEISKSMVVARHLELGAHPVGANRALRMVRSIWNHARRTHDLPESPTIAIEWYDERPNGTVITDLAEWRRTIDALSNPIQAVFYELALFTGLRRSELTNLEWRHVHEDQIHLPITKNGRSFDLPIVQQHHEILAPLRGLSKKWVFPSPRSSTGNLRDPSRLQWSPHAHRRTFATVAIEAGVLEEIVGRLLNHTPITITGHRYIKPSLDALRPSMEVICKELSERTSV